MILLDASVLLAHLAGEPRGEAVTALLGRGGLARPTIQLAEAVDVLGRRGIHPRRSDDAVATLDGDLAAMAREEGCSEREDLPRAGHRRPGLTSSA